MLSIVKQLLRTHFGFPACLDENLRTCALRTLRFLHWLAKLNPPKSCQGSYSEAP